MKLCCMGGKPWMKYLDWWHGASIRCSLVVFHLWILMDKDWILKGKGNLWQSATSALHFASSGVTGVTTIWFLDWTLRGLQGRTNQCATYAKPLEKGIQPRNTIMWMRTRNSGETCMARQSFWPRKCPTMMYVTLRSWSKQSVHFWVFLIFNLVSGQPERSVVLDSHPTGFHFALRPFDWHSKFPPSFDQVVFIACSQSWTSLYCEWSIVEPWLYFKKGVFERVDVHMHVPSGPTYLHLKCSL